MAALTAARRDNLPDSVFAGPGRSYPVQDRSHAVDAKGRATQQENAGNLSPAEADKIRARADAVLNGHEGARDEHLNLHGAHSALSDHHAKAGDKHGAKLHHTIAGHHLKLAEHHHNIAEAFRGGEPEAAEQTMQPAARPQQRTADSPSRPAATAGTDHMAIGAATQLHKKGHIDTATRDRIHKSAGARRPFGSLAGAGHYMGDVDEANSPGTNAV